jgi:antitoxin (DNA-binding transcriptional repressor) of toxin-antitoxin stability system
MLQKSVSKSYLKANMLRIFRELETSNEELIVTDNNTPVLIIKPIKQSESVEALFGNLQGQVVYHEDLDTPTLDEWEGL